MDQGNIVLINDTLRLVSKFPSVIAEFDTPCSCNDLGFQKYTEQPLKSRKMKLTGVI